MGRLCNNGETRISAIRAKDDKGAKRPADESRYGLGTGVFPKDEKRAPKLARNRFDTGRIA